ncbi:hypothetical protein [Psychrobacter pygoscelis]|uniref:hypothetical protein n=1 Tax=Psychrobacter pygoscelis TaxID=2488563 RepID=UPI00103C0D2E|nr:hypothetical protein [Psychrobacter pygoscelis]
MSIVVRFELTESEAQQLAKIVAEHSFLMSANSKNLNKQGKASLSELLSAQAKINTAIAEHIVCSADDVVRCTTPEFYQ